MQRQVPWNKGKKLSNEHRLNLSISHKGKPAWNKGLRGVTIPWNKGTRGVMKAWNKGLYGVMPPPANKGKKGLYQHSEETRNKISLAQKGKRSLENHPNWKGGSIQNGYRIVRYNGKYIKEHRLIMQRHLGRVLLPSELVHHKDGNKLNNKIDNLELVEWREHTIHHNPKILGRTIKCVLCGILKPRYSLKYSCCKKCYVHTYLKKTKP